VVGGGCGDVCGTIRSSKHLYPFGKEKIRMNPIIFSNKINYCNYYNSFSIVRKLHSSSTLFI